MNWQMNADRQEPSRVLLLAMSWTSSSYKYSSNYEFHKLRADAGEELVFKETL